MKFYEAWQNHITPTFGIFDDGAAEISLLAELESLGVMLLGFLIDLLLLLVLQLLQLDLQIRVVWVDDIRPSGRKWTRMDRNCWRRPVRVPNRYGNST